MIWNTSLHTEGSANLLRRSAFPYSFGTCDDRAEFCGLRVFELRTCQYLPYIYLSVRSLTRYSYISYNIRSYINTWQRATSTSTYRASEIAKYLK